METLSTQQQKQGFIVSEVAKSSAAKDEFYTPAWAVTPILPYLKPKSTVWCPFDTEQSYYVKVLLEAGHTVVHTHLSDGHDFFVTEPPQGCDYIISNPPYSLKAKVFERLFKLGIPYAMLVGVVGLFESKERFNLFKNNPFEMMYFDRRISFFQDYATPDKLSLNPPFSTVYVCQGMLPEPVLFVELNKPYAKKHSKLTNLGGC